MNINEIRYGQQRQQSQSLKALNQLPIVTYQGRDAATGQRKLLAADGGQVVANYLGTSEPAVTPFYSPVNALGIPGYMANR
jgi:hypothetical protein